MLSRRAVFGSAIAGLSAAPALAQAPASAWPNERAIEVVVPVPPGGGLDALARMLMPYVCARLSPQARFVVMNRPGAGTQIGNEAVFNAAPDGYTLGCITCPALPALPIERVVRYRTMDFNWVANVVDDANAFFVLNTSPLRSLGDLVAAARTRPGTITYGSTGIGGDDHIAMLAFEGMANLPPLVHVPFTGSAPATQALLGGHLDLLVGNISDFIGVQREGRVLALGVASAERYSPLAQVRTFKEQGFDFAASASRGFVGPPGMPDAMKAQLEAAFRGALADPAFIAEAARVTMPLRPVVGAEYRAMIATMDENLKALWARRPWRE